MNKMYSLYEIVFWIIFLAMAFEFNIHWTYLIFPGLLMTVDSLLSNYNKPTNND